MDSWRPIFFLFIIVVGVTINILISLVTADCEERQIESSNSCFFAQRIYQLVLSGLIYLLIVFMILLGLHLNLKHRRQYRILKRNMQQLAANNLEYTHENNRKKHRTNFGNLVIYLYKKFKKRSPSSALSKGLFPSRTSAMTLKPLTNVNGTNVKDVGLHHRRTDATHNHSNTYHVAGREGTCDKFRVAMLEMFARKVTTHQMRIGYILAIATVVGYSYKFLVVMMFQECKTVLKYPGNPIEHPSDAMYYFGCIMLYSIICFWLHVLNKVPHRTLCRTGANVVSDFIMALLMLLFIKVNADEGLVMHHHLQQNASHHASHHLKDNASHLSTHECSESKQAFLDVIDERFISPVVYLIKAEAIPVLLFLLYAVKNCPAHLQHQPECHNTHENGVSKIKQVITIIVAVLASLSCPVTIYTLFYYVSHNHHEEYGSYNIASCTTMFLQLVLLCLLHMWVKLEDNHDHGPEHEAHLQHAKLDVRLLFISLGPIYVLITTAIISLCIEWHPAEAHIHISDLVEDVIVFLLYTEQYFCFKRLMYCSHHVLQRQKGIVLPGIIGIMICSYLGWFITFVERMFVDKLFMTSQDYFSEPLWAAILAISYPGMVFINFHTAVCCLVLLLKIKRSSHSRRMQIEKTLSNNDSLVVLKLDITDGVM